MDERVVAIEKLTSLRKLIIERDRILSKTQQLRQQKKEAAESQYESVSISQASTSHEAILKEDLLSQKEKIAEKKQSSIRVIFLLLSIALMVFSIVFLANLPVTKFVTDSDYRSVFWIAHCLLSAFFTLLVIVPLTNSK